MSEISEGEAREGRANLSLSLVSAIQPLSPVTTNRKACHPLSQEIRSPEGLQVISMTW